MKKHDLTPHLGQTFTAIIDRPLGSRHPEWRFEYKLNYGYIPNLPAPDGEDQDVYVMGVNEPLQSFTGVCIAVILREDDVEGKLVLTPIGRIFSREQISEAVGFQERFFKSQVILPDDLL